MALDGFGVGVAKPRLQRDGVVNPNAYWNRKDMFALVCQVGCDANCRFLHLFERNAGSSHDSSCWKKDPLRLVLETAERQGLNLADYPNHRIYILGDAAYGANELLLVPFKGKNLSLERDAYNFYQSSQRIHIERAFGILTARWGVLWRPLVCSLEHAMQTVRCCMVLNNICTKRFTSYGSSGAVGAGVSALPGDRDGIDGKDDAVHYQNDCSTMPAEPVTRGSQARDDMVRSIRAAGLKRPKRSKYRS